jgi:D-beta-D-heptose 7-phosphate kinase / D-beta-D-heptose 1-phosphate adenosyltransferase
VNKRGGNPQVLVLGDAVLDGWLEGRARRLCREAPVPVIEVTGTAYAPGGAANTAANFAALGASTRLIAAVGDDDTGRRLRQSLADAAVQAHLVEVKGRRTVVKRRVVAEGQVVARFDEGDTFALPQGKADLLIEAAAATLTASDAVVVCEYAAGTVPDDLVAAIEQRRAEIPFLAVDAHDLTRWRRVRPDVVTPSIAEAARLIGEETPEEDRMAWAAARIEAVHEATGSRTVIVTVDVDGTVARDEDGTVTTTRSRPVPQAYASGAGDSFLAGYVVAALAEQSARDAAVYAQAVAETVLNHPGTTVCHAPGSEGILDADELANTVAAARRDGKRIVFTNGCFDVVHHGHVAYLVQAKTLGDLLIVAVNSDDSVRRLKGPQRPVNPEEDRAAVLAELSSVDCVVIFDEDSPASLLEQIRPDVYVKGGDYPLEMIPEADLVRELGGEVRVMPYLPDRSTSAIIERIRTRAHHEQSA